MKERKKKKGMKKNKRQETREQTVVSVTLFFIYFFITGSRHKISYQSYQDRRRKKKGEAPPATAFTRLDYGTSPSISL